MKMLQQLNKCSLLIMTFEKDKDFVLCVSLELIFKSTAYFHFLVFLLPFPTVSEVNGCLKRGLLSYCNLIVFKQENHLDT